MMNSWLLFLFGLTVGMLIKGFINEMALSLISKTAFLDAIVKKLHQDVKVKKTFNERLEEKMNESNK